MPTSTTDSATSQWTGRPGTAVLWGCAALSLLLHGLLLAVAVGSSDNGPFAAAEQPTLQVSLTAPAPAAEPVHQPLAANAGATPEHRPQPTPPVEHRQRPPATARTPAKAAAPRAKPPEKIPVGANGTESASLDTAPSPRNPAAGRKPTSFAHVAPPSLKPPAAVAGESHKPDPNKLISRIHAMLAQRFVYPWMARRRGMEGTVWLSFHVTAAGRIEQIQVMRSSGFSVLDRSAVDTVATLEPIANAGRWLTDQGIQVELPLVYRLTDG